MRSTYILDQKGLQSKLPTSFEGMAVAATYNLMRSRQPDNPLFVAGKRSWEAFMRRQPLITTIYRKPDTVRYANHFLVEALEVIELLKTGLSSSGPNAILGGKRQMALDVTKFLLNERVPGIERRGRIDIEGTPTWVHPDPPDNPLAYFGLSAGVYARAVRELGSSASSRTRRPILDAANAAVWVTGPDGDSRLLRPLAGGLLGQRGAGPGHRGRGGDEGGHGEPDRALSRGDRPRARAPS